MPEKWLTVGQAARWWQVSPWTVRAWFHAGRVEGVQFSPRCIRILVRTQDEEVRDAVQGQAEEVREG